MSNPIVAIAMPSRSQPGTDVEALANGIVAKATRTGRLDAAPGVAWTSLLPYTFNTLWTGFLNMRAGPQKPTYFAMIHDDIIPSPGWLDVLVDELEARQADLISVAVAIKDTRGLTSVGVDCTGDPWNPRRLTMTELFALPETYGDADAGHPLVHNTGLWVCRLDRDWCRKVFFRQQDRIVRLPDGSLAAQTISEDWDFSRQVRKHGGVLIGTRKVKVIHERTQWHNQSPWGTWTTDEEFRDPQPAIPAKAA